MKNLIFLVIALLALNFFSFSQITNIKVSEKVKINKLYVGSLSGISFKIDSLEQNSFSTIRVGALVTYLPINWISIKAHSTMETNGLAINQFWASICPLKKISIDVGLMGSLPTEQRPFPATPAGQFEAWSEKKIPGQSLGIKIKYDMSNTYRIATGVVTRNNLPEYSGRISYKESKISVWYSEHNQKFGSALTISSGKVYSTLVWEQDQTIADVFVLQLDKGKKFTFYSDLGYNLLQKKLVRGEIGLLRNFKSKYIKGLFGLGYDFGEGNDVVTYLFLHL